MIWALVAAGAFALAALVLGVELVGERAKSAALAERLDRVSLERSAALSLLAEQRLPRGPR